MHSPKTSAHCCKLFSFLRVMLISALVACFVGPLKVSAQTTIDSNLDDSALAPGRSAAGVAFGPAAFSGIERPDTASFLMNELLLSLSGRGGNFNLELNYDSNLYQKSAPPGQSNLIVATRPVVDHNVYIDAIQGWPAYGFSMGFGTLIVHNSKVLCHNSPLTCGNAPVGHPPVHSALTYIDRAGVRYRTGDLRLGSESGSPTVTYPDGTKLIFGSSPQVFLSSIFQNGEWIFNFTFCRQFCDVSDEAYFPTKIVDRNGNFILINYVNGKGPAIATITDTLGRVIRFHYSNGNLASITVPDASSAGEHEVVRFRVVNGTRVHDFPDNNGHTSYNEAIKILTNVSFPDTKSGWHYDYSSYGMIYRVEKLLGLELDPNSSAVTNPGQVIAVTEYNYPRFASHLGFQLPSYTTRTDQGIDVFGVLSSPLVHQFSVSYFDGIRKSVVTTTAPDQTTTEVTRRYYPPSAHNSAEWQATWDDGLVLLSKVVKDGAILSQVENNWGTTPTPRGPRLYDQTVTNDAGRQMKTVYDYFDPPNSSAGVFDNIRTKTDYMFDSASEVRRTEYTYETDPAWTNRWLVKLKKSVKVFQGGATQPLTQLDFTYDSGSLTSYSTLPQSYDANTPNERGNLTRVSSNTNAASPANGTTLTTTRSYDIFGNVVQITDAKGNVSQMDFADAFSDNQIRNTYAYRTSSITTIPDPTGAHGSNTALTESAVFNYFTGLTTAQGDVNGQTTYYEYNDSANRLTKVIRPDGGWTSYEYNNVPGSIYVRVLTLQQTTPIPQVLESRQYSDGLGQVVRSCLFEGGTWLITDSKYDLLNHTSSVSNPYRTTSPNGELNPSNSWTTTLQDALGRDVSVTMPDGTQTRADYQDTMALATDAAGNKRLMRSDELGRITDVWEIISGPATESVVFQNQTLTGYHTAYAYDVQGNLLKVTQGSQQRFFSYDSLSRLIRVKNPEQDSRSALALTDPLTNNSDWSIGYSYDNNGNLRTKTDPRGVVTTFDYDNLNRLVSRSYTDGTPSVSYTYDLAPGTNARGRLSTVSSSVSSYAYGDYDPMGRARSGIQTTDGQAYSMMYEYNVSGQLTSQTYPSGRKVITEFEGAGRIAGIKKGAGGAYYAGGAVSDGTQIQYTAHGAPAVMRLGNGLWETMSFNSRLQPTQVGIGSASSNADVLNLLYDYGIRNNNGNVRSQTITFPGVSLVQTYAYDEINRLKSAREVNGKTQIWKQSFIYDQYGNRNFDVANTTAPSPLSNLTVNPSTNRFDPNAPGQGLIGYDQAGNLTRETAGNSYGYDGENRLISYNGGIPPAGSPNNIYDGDGRRVKTTTSFSTTIFVYNVTGQLVAEYGSAASDLGGTQYLFTDVLGSPRVVTDSFASVREMHDYFPFGETLDGYGPRLNFDGDRHRQKFTGYEKEEEINLYFAQARHYSSGQGRFNSPDPTLASANSVDPQSWNRYTYCGNDPINRTDPTGLDWYRDIYEEGVSHPVWLNYNPGPDSRYVPWDQGFVYWNVETKQWWFLNPHAYEQGPVSSQKEGEYRVGSSQLAYNYAQSNWDPTCRDCKAFVEELGVKRGPALVQSMEYMWMWMSLFTGPVTSGGTITSLGLKGAERTGGQLLLKGVTSEPLTQAERKLFREISGRVTKVVEGEADNAILTEAEQQLAAKRYLYQAYKPRSTPHPWATELQLREYQLQRAGRVLNNTEAPGSLRNWLGMGP